MNRLAKLSLSALVASNIAACGLLEPSVVKTVASEAVVAVGQKGVASGSIAQIFRTDRCSDLSRGGFIWFTDTVSLDDWLAPLSSELMAQVKSKVDFSKQGVLLLDYGIAGTGGAGSTIMGDSLELKGSEAIVKIKRYEPSSTDKKKRAQVVTHPCSLHVMPRAGFNTLVIQSEQGDRLTSFVNVQAGK